MIGKNLASFTVLDTLSYVNVFKQVMEKMNVDDWQSRLIGLATDGCSAMRGRKDGFAVRLQRQVSVSLDHSALRSA